MNYSINGNEIVVGDVECEIAGIESNNEHIIAGNNYLREQKMDLAKASYERAPLSEASIAYYNLALIAAIEQVTDDMAKYYLLASENGNINATLNLAMYHKEQKDYDAMIKYYLLAIEKGSVIAMKKLAYHYGQIKDCDNMVKYYLLAAENGNSDAMFNLATHYRSSGDTDSMLKYYLLAAERGDPDAMFNLGHHYQQVHDYDTMLKYYQLAIENNSLSAMFNLGYYYEELAEREQMIKYYLMVTEHKKCTNHVEHLNYCVGRICTIELLEKYREHLDESNVDKLSKLLAGEEVKHIMLPRKIIKKCHICFEKGSIMALSCKHELCEECFCKINNTNTKCPFCREMLTVPDELYLAYA